MVARREDTTDARRAGKEATRAATSISAVGNQIGARPRGGSGSAGEFVVATTSRIRNSCVAGGMTRTSASRNPHATCPSEDDETPTVIGGRPAAPIHFMCHRRFRRCSRARAAAAAPHRACSKRPGHWVESGPASSSSERPSASTPKAASTSAANSMRTAAIA